MNPAMATVIAAACAAASGVVVAALSAWLGRGARKADIVDKVSEASDRIMGRMSTEIAHVEARCDECIKELQTAEAETKAAREEAAAARQEAAAARAEAADARVETRRSNAVLRKLVRALDANDQEARDQAIVAAKALI